MSIETFSRRLAIPDGEGLHFRAAAALANAAKEFQSEIWVGIDGRKVDAKIAIDLLSLAAGPNAEITLEAKGLGRVHGRQCDSQSCPSRFQEVF